MVFSSLLFTFIFLPVVMGLHFLVKGKARNYLLLAASLLFYAYGEPRFVFVMLACVMASYTAAVFIDKAKAAGREKRAKLILTADIAASLGLLFVYKYLDFSLGILGRISGRHMPVFGLALPIGISFFTFQALSYVIDVYRGSVRVQKNPVYVALYISFFPQLIAGPIVRYSTIRRQIENRQCTRDKFGRGAKRYMAGFCKKIILANNLSVVAGRAMAGADFSLANPLFLWLGALCYTLQIYYDFSGYSDMAIGLGRIFGFEFEENFNYPYISKSVTEFWRRWHISLGGWFRDYVYIPLGGSRVGRARHIFNMFVVWLFTGLWHGASLSFVAWGMWYFILLVAEKYIVKPHRLKSPLLKSGWQAVTLLRVIFGWVIFAVPGLTAGVKYCAGMLGLYGTKPFVDRQIIRYLREYGAYMIIGVLLATPVFKKPVDKISRLPSVEKALYLLEPLGYTVRFLWAASFLILGAHNPFIYFNF